MDTQLIYLASGARHDVPSRPGLSFVDGEPVFLPLPLRWLAVYCVSNSQEQATDYVVMVSDGQEQDLRSWTVGGDLVVDHPDKEYFEIPGPDWSDNVIVPYLGTSVMGGIGSTVMEMPFGERIFSQLNQLYRRN